MKWWPVVALVLLVCVAQAVRAEPPRSTHWAYQTVVRPPLPEVRQTSWPQNAIDYFILAKLEANRLSPSPPATKQQLLRRVTFDLTGLPPTWGEVAAFEQDSAPDALERVVDRLLSSPRYGERMATHWLDLARYADTHGFHLDSHRDMWRYRDQVIDAFSRHQRFDQFTIEQLAGDLLPNATLSQKIASGFNRNHMVNYEGGAIPAEYLDKYVADRVTTTATVWLGQTFECARCHDHKHDPFTTRDFYAFYAFFNNVPEEGIDGQHGNAAPYLMAPTREQASRLADYDRSLAELATAMQKRAAESSDAQAAWETKVRTDASVGGSPPEDAVLHLRLDETAGATTSNAADRAAAPAKIIGDPQWLPGKFQGALLFDGETSLEIAKAGQFNATDACSFSAWVYPTTRDAMTIASHVDEQQAGRGYELTMDDGLLQLSLSSRTDGPSIIVRGKVPLAARRWQHVVATYDGSRSAAGMKIYVDGKAVELTTSQNDLGENSISTLAPLRLGRGPVTSFRGLLDEVQVFVRELSATEVALLSGNNPIQAIAAIKPELRTPAQSAALRELFLHNHDAEYQRLRRDQLKLLQARRALINVCPTTMVMAERIERRPTFILDRGDYQLPTDEVTADTPSALPAFPSDVPRNRLSLAHWLVSGNHPLTARVTVNRLWQLHFGGGLVATSDDFGTAGTPPSHPELLDWLADELVHSGWNLQHIQRLIVTSATYQQSCVATREQLASDQENILLARFPRVRLTAEMVRDQALFASGLLVGEVGGRSVFPYQPAGLWEEVGRDDGEHTAQSYSPGSGADLYRRSLYTFWKRTSPPPALSLFDAPDRETCMVTRNATNTPLQALALWNDPTFVEASRALAARSLCEGAMKPEERATLIFRTIMGRNPVARETNALAHLFARQLAVYRADESSAVQLLAMGKSTSKGRCPPAELAAWTTVVQTVLCSDAALHRN